MSHSQTTAYVNKVENNCTSTLCNAPDVAPVTRKGALCIIHDFIFEKNSIQTFSSSAVVLFSAAFTCLTGLPPVSSLLSSPSVLLWH